MEMEEERGNDNEGSSTTPAVTARKLNDGDESNQTNKRDGGDKLVATTTGGGGGAEYIDPKMRKSTDFTSWLSEPKTKEKLAGKTVMMFCTGERLHIHISLLLCDDTRPSYVSRGRFG
jgi:hypothetical protein